MNNIITIGIQSKGRLKDKAIEFFETNGLKILQNEKERNYFATIRNKPNIKIIYLYDKLFKFKKSKKNMMKNI